MEIWRKREIVPDGEVEDDRFQITITDALEIQAKQGKVIAYKFKGKRFDCGSINGFLEATNHFAKKIIN